MTIDSYDIETVLGLKLLKVEGFHDLPRRKRILREPGSSAGLIKYDERKITVHLYAKAATTALVGAIADALRTILEMSQVHTFTIPEQGISVLGVCKDGFSTELHRKIIRITLPIYNSSELEIR